MPGQGASGRRFVENRVLGQLPSEYVRGDYFVYTSYAGFLRLIRAFSFLGTMQWLEFFSASFPIVVCFCVIATLKRYRN